MKRVLYFFGLLVAVQALSEQKIELMKAMSEDCKQSSKVTQDILDAVKDKKDDIYLKDANMNKFSYCMLQKIRVIDQNGVFTPDLIMAVVVEEDKTSVEEGLKTCQKEVEKVDESTATLFCKCFIRKNPDYMVI